MRIRGFPPELREKALREAFEYSLCYWGGFRDPKRHESADKKACIQRELDLLNAYDSDAGAGEDHELIPIEERRGWIPPWRRT